MRKLTIELPDTTHDRLMACCEQRRTSVDCLIDEMVTLLLIEADAETRHRMRSQIQTKDVARGIELLRKARGE
jgi:hypothetical protein